MAKRKTFDILDAELGVEVDSWRTLPDAQRFKSYRHDICIDPKNWESYQPPKWALDLKWSEFRYSAIKANTAIDKLITSDYSGIYIFYVRPNSPINNFPQFPLYVGISNERDSKRPLKERLKDYLPSSLSQIRKRENVHTMLQMYYDCLWVSYALTDKTSSDLEALEECIHGFLHPCFGRRDFPVAIKKQQKAFGVI